VIVLVRVGLVFVRVLPGVITLDSVTGSGSSPSRP
jgi:hypothetical protein